MKILLVKLVKLIKRLMIRTLTCLMNNHFWRTLNYLNSFLTNLERTQNLTHSKRENKIMRFSIKTFTNFQLNIVFLNLI
jgi:hypothetical protein